LRELEGLSIGNLTRSGDFVRPRRPAIARRLRGDHEATALGIFEKISEAPNRHRVSTIKSIDVLPRELPKTDNLTAKDVFWLGIATKKTPAKIGFSQAFAWRWSRE
jgi:hypothetical protein